MRRETYEGCDYRAYLKRIGYTGEAKPNLETLTLLQELHVKAVPYENLEIMEKKPLTLDIPTLYEKVVARKRGGYCFELNGLFAWLLEEIGFHVVQHFGRWLRGEPLAVPMRRHRALRVLLDGKGYICDVGVGMVAPRQPLLFAFDSVQKMYGESYRIVKDEVNINVVQYLSHDGTWKNLYSFTDDPCVSIDYFQPHYYCTTHPDSAFVNTTMVYIRTEDGRHTIADTYDPATGEKIRELRSYGKDGLDRTLILTQKQLEEILVNLFGIDINA